MSTETTPVERDEGLIGQLTRVDDFCRRGGVDAEKIMPAVEGVIKATRSVREAAEAAGLNQRARRVVSDAIGGAIREGME